MTPRMAWTAAERNTLLDHLRPAPEPALRLRAPIILLLAEGDAWATTAAVRFGSSRTIARGKDRFE